MIDLTNQVKSSRREIIQFVGAEDGDSERAGSPGESAGVKIEVLM